MSGRGRSQRSSARWHTGRSGLASVTVAAALALVGCGDDEAGNPESRLTLREAQAPLAASAPPELDRLRAQANDLFDGGLQAFEARLVELRGLPVVVNVWASWCGPCRFEFPHLQAEAQARGDEVAFIGVDSQDSDDAAEEFLAELPLPFPSYADPEREITRELDVGPGLPNTIFFGRDGEVTYHLRGPIESEEQLARLIERYAS